MLGTVGPEVPVGLLPGEGKEGEIGKCYLEDKMIILSKQLSKFKEEYTIYIR